VKDAIEEERRRWAEYYAAFRGRFRCCLCGKGPSPRMALARLLGRRMICDCGGRERQRGLYTVIIFHTDLLTRDGAKVLHTSPAFERSLIQRVRSLNPSLDYLTSDLKDEGADLLLDLADIDRSFERRFDFIINLHVLEHLREGEQVPACIDNLRRMLKAGGILILGVPQDWELDAAVLEDPSADPNWEHYRKFGARFVELLGSFSRVEVLLDTRQREIADRLTDLGYEPKDIFLGIANERLKRYADAQVFYLCRA